MEINLISQSFPAGIISNDVDVDVDVDVDDTDVEKGQESSVTAVAQQQQQEHSVASEEVMSRRGLTPTDQEDEKASFRSRMMGQQKSSSLASMSILISSLSHNLRKSVRDLQLDVDGDGKLDTDEILSAVKHLTTQTKTHSSLRKIVCALCTFLLLLVVCVFASTITAARLAIDTEVDPMSGIMYAKGGAHNVMKTEAVAIYSNSTTVAQMTNADLDILKAILPGTGGVKFQVKGYARKMGSEDEVRVLVEGGTITYDSQGIKDATGNAKVLLTFAYGDLLDSYRSTHYLYGPNDVYVSGG